MAGLMLKVRKVDGNVEVDVAGMVDEKAQAALTDLQKKIGEEHAVFNLAQIGPINSIGFKHWTTFLAALRAQTSFELTQCNETIMNYASMMPVRSCADKITSIDATYECMKCNARESLTADVSTADAREVLSPTLICPKCDGTMTCAALDPELWASIEESSYD